MGKGVFADKDNMTILDNHILSSDIRIEKSIHSLWGFHMLYNETAIFTDFVTFEDLFDYLT